MTTPRKHYAPEFKAKVALETLSNTMTLSELSTKYSVHPIMISRWKNDLLNNSSKVFADPRKKDDDLRKKEEELEEAYKQVGQVTIERDWLKKKFRQLGGV